MTAEVMDGKGIPSQRKKVDWESVEKDWRAGIKTKLQISEQYGVSRAAIDKRFQKLGVERDLTEKIRQKAEALVTQQLVTEQVTKDRLVTTEREVVEVNAQMQANLIVSQRKDIRRYSELAQKLLAELESAAQDKELFEQLGELLRSEDAKGVDRLNDVYNKVIALPGRIDNLKKLSEVLKTLIGLERQAFGIADVPPEEPTKPKDPAGSTDLEIARRLAFLLVRPMKGAL